MSAKKSTKARSEKATASKASAASNTNFEQVFGLKNNPTMEKIMTQGKTKFEKIGQDAANAGREHMEAIVKSGNIFAKGFEGFLKTYAALAQTATERNAETFKELLSCKTLNELTETQNKAAQESFDEFMAGVTRLSELSVKLTTEALEPINDQFSKSIRKATGSVAA